MINAGIPAPGLGTALNHDASFTHNPESQRADDLPDGMIPEAFAEHQDSVYVTGASASPVDLNAVLDTWTPVVFAFVLGLSFVQLTVAFRSIVVPLKAVIMNLLSVGSAYGLPVLVFQKGYGADLLGFTQVDTLAAWIPVFLFCILFGLSMDYHVFLLSRGLEHRRCFSRGPERWAACGSWRRPKTVTTP